MNTLFMFTLLTIREMQIKITVSIYTPNRMAKIKHVTTPNVCSEVEFICNSPKLETAQLLLAHSLDQFHSVFIIDIHIVNSTGYFSVIVLNLTKI